MKRIFLFLLTNFAVLIVLSLSMSLLGVGRYLSSQGIDYVQLLIFAALIGFTGSIISLFMSKTMAKTSTGAQVIDPQHPRNHQEAWLINTVSQLAQRAKIKMPEVAIYQGAPNAFATGAFKNDSLVAVSTGLLQSMNEEEITAVLGHEITHVSNGDMVTLTLIQGVVNTFVVFLSRLIGTLIDRGLSRNQNEGYGAGYTIAVVVCEIVFGFLASIIVCYFSRQREFRADAGSVHLLGSRQPMIHALQRLGQMESGQLPNNMTALGINNSHPLASLFASHPPIEKRIQALQNLAS